MKSINTLVVLLLIASNSHAESACNFTVFGVGLGVGESQAAAILESRGFRRIDATRTFTNEELWPPEGVELTREQMTVATHLTDPEMSAALWKMAETDVELKELLESIPLKPETPVQIGIHLDMGDSPRPGGRRRASANQSASTESGVREISVAYIYSEDRWLGRNEPGVIVFSAEHDARDARRWAQYCGDAGPRDQQGANFDSAEQERSCSTDPTGSGGTFMQITVQDKLANHCFYQYSSRGQGGDERLR